MSNEKNGMPETLESLGERIVALGESMDKRFDEVKAQLRAQIEAVDANVKLVYDTVIGQNDKNKANEKAHKQFKKRLDDHDVRILALENPKPPTT